MIFAELEYPEHYSDFHDELVEFIQSIFPDIQYGHQGDSWIWITDGKDKVEIDTFTSMKHQIKSAHNGLLVQKVMGVLSAKYKVRVFEIPEPEAHED
ncbi:hypothetical protein [Methylomonas sp. MgM2]